MANTVWKLQGDHAQAVGQCQSALTALGYSVVLDQDGWGGAAEVGSVAGRMLLGGFARRNKVTFRVYQDESGPALALAPAMTGASGGALGLAKANKEHQQVVTAVTGALETNGLVAGGPPAP